MKMKDATVTLDGLRAPMMAAIPLIDEVHRNLTGQEATCTSSTGDKHRVARSAHYRGDAVDLRVWSFADTDPVKEREKIQGFADALIEKLGPDFVVLNESDHIHVHWGPIYRSV